MPSSRQLARPALRLRQLWPGPGGGTATQPAGPRVSHPTTDSTQRRESRAPPEPETRGGSTQRERSEGSASVCVCQGGEKASLRRCRVQLPRSSRRKGGRGHRGRSRHEVLQGQEELQVPHLGGKVLQGCHLGRRTASTSEPEKWMVVVSRLSEKSLRLIVISVSLV